MPDNILNAPLYRSRIRTSLYGSRLALDDDGMLIGPPALKKEVRSISTTVPTTVAAHGVTRILTSGSTQGPTQHFLAAPLAGVELTMVLVSTSTGSQQFGSTANGASIVATSLGTTVGWVNFQGPGGSITLIGLSTSQWAVKARDDITSTGLARAITFTTST